MTVHITAAKSATGDNYVVLQPDDPITNIPLVICHGAGDTSASWAGGRANQTKIAWLLAYAGFPAIAHDLGGDLFGNSTAMARVDDARSIMAALGYSAAFLFMLGVSMGWFTICQYAATHASAVKALAGYLTGADINAIYAADRAGQQTVIAGDWGVTAPAALPAGASITAGSAVAAAIATAQLAALVRYSSGDTTTLPSEVQAQAAALGPNVDLATFSTGSHSDVTMADALDANGRPSTVARFFMAHK